MGSSSNFSSLLDFDHGLDFEVSMRKRFGKRINGDSFKLLATFRRFLFRLTEDSVALALQSCLGGKAADFQVTYLSHNHFSFTVSCKSVGFSVYELRRFTGRSFDIYFHLWSNGVPHWEREKRLWEEEEAKKWTEVLSKAQKKTVKAKEKSVCFAKKLVQSPPKIKSRPREELATLVIGAVEINLDELGLLKGIDRPPSILLSDTDNARSLNLSDKQFTEQSVQSDSSSSLHNFEKLPVRDEQVSSVSHCLNTGARNSLAENNAIVNVRRLGHCTRCFGLNHKAINCLSAIRCAACFKYGHRYKWCFTKKKPKVCWQPKLPFELKGPQRERSNSGTPSSSAGAPPKTRDVCHSTALHSKENPHRAAPSSEGSGEHHQMAISSATRSFFRA